MQQSTPLKSLTTTQLVALGIIVIVALFLVIGTIMGSPTPDGGFATTLRSQSFLVLALLSFFGGVLSFTSPCTLPILPAYFAFAFQSGRKQIAANTMAFMLGLGSMFSLLGASASILGQLLRQNSDLLLLVGGSFILIFGVMSLLGKGFAGLQQEEREYSTTLGGSYLFGLTFALGWTSCTGPILGTVLTLAAYTSSMLTGVMLLFIYTLGLGLPLLLVSTLFGRASRQNLFWRVLRGKGWTVTVPRFAVGVIWILAIWRILVALGNFALSENHALASRPLTPLQAFGLLGIAIAGVALWVLTGTEKEQMTLHLHSTKLISGVLFVTLGVLMLSGIMARLNSFIPPDLAIWFAGIEEALITFFN